MEFDLTAGDIVIPEVCPILKEPFDLDCVAKSRNAPTIDRIKAKGGYVRGNAVSWRKTQKPGYLQSRPRFLHRGVGDVRW